MSAERLAVALWGEDAPPSAVKTVQVYVSRLRKALGDPDVLVTTPAGYRLRVRAGELDAERFERQVAEGRAGAGRRTRASERPRSCARRWSCGADRRWRSSPRRRSRRPRSRVWRSCTSRRVEVRVEADLAAGRHAELVAELQQLTASTRGASGCTRS